MDAKISLEKNGKGEDVLVLSNSKGIMVVLEITTYQKKEIELLLGTWEPGSFKILAVQENK